MAGLGPPDAGAGGRWARPADQAPILASRELRTRAEQARATAAMLVEQCLGALAQSLRACGQAADTYADACAARQAAANRRSAVISGQDGTPSLGSFEVEGLIDDQPVGATLAGGRLVCDRALWARAELLVDLGEVFNDEADWPRYVASLEGPEVAVALTLLRACDRVVGFSLGIPIAQAADGPDQTGAPRRNPPMPPSSAVP